jgi:membrane associated rhomboid family serine protease
VTTLNILVAHHHSEHCGRHFLQVQVGKLVLNVGPSEMTAVIFRQQSWRMFDFGFLKIWGGRYAPSIKKQHQWTRWFTSIFVHESFNHVLSNMLLWLVLGCYLVRGLGSRLGSRLPFTLTS